MIEMKRVSLRDVLRHSALIDRIEIGGGMEIVIQPWTPVVLDEVQPLLHRFLSQFKAVMQQMKDKKEDIAPLDVFLSFLEKNSESMKETVNDLLHIIYVTIERSNQTITINDKKFEIFTEEEMREEFPLSKLIEIAKIIYSQNYEKNRSGGSILMPKTTETLTMQTEVNCQGAKA